MNQETKKSLLLMLVEASTYPYKRLSDFSIPKSSLVRDTPHIREQKKNCAGLSSCRRGIKAR
jgi:hypothetical protein